MTAVKLLLDEEEVINKASLWNTEFLGESNWFQFWSNWFSKTYGEISLWLKFYYKA